MIPGSGHTPALAFAAVQDKIREAVIVWGHLGGFTYNPKSDAVFNVRNPREARALNGELVRGSIELRADLPVYLIAVTHHIGTRTDCILREGYEAVSVFSNQPLIGYWRDPAGSPYLDAVAPMQFISRNDAVMEGRRYGQRVILAVWPDGTYEYVETDQEHVRPGM